MIGIIKADENKDVDKSIGDFSSPEVMRKSGWIFDAAFQYDPKYSKNCGKAKKVIYESGCSQSKSVATLQFLINAPLCLLIFPKKSAHHDLIRYPLCLMQLMSSKSYLAIFSHFLKNTPTTTRLFHPLRLLLL